MLAAPSAAMLKFSSLFQPASGGASNLGVGQCRRLKHTRAATASVPAPLRMVVVCQQGYLNIPFACISARMCNLVSWSARRALVVRLIVFEVKNEFG